MLSKEVFLIPEAAFVSNPLPCSLPKRLPLSPTLISSFSNLSYNSSRNFISSSI